MKRSTKLLLVTAGLSLTLTGCDQVKQAADSLPDFSQVTDTVKSWLPDFGGDSTDVEKTSQAPTEGGDPIFVSEEEWRQWQEGRAGFAQAHEVAYDHLKALQSVSLEVTTRVTMGDREILFQQHNVENYADATLKGYLIDLTTQVQDQTMLQRMQYDGETYRQQNYLSQWSESENPYRTPITYLSILKVLFDTPESWESQEADGQLTISKTLNADQTKQVLPMLLDLPMRLVGDYELDGQADYVFNQETKELQSAKLSAKIHSLGQDYQVEVDVQPSFQAEAHDLTVNTDERMTPAVAAEGLLDQFKLANPTMTTIVYDSSLIDVQAGTEEYDYNFHNLFAAKPIFGLKGRVKGDAADYQGVYVGDHYYTMKDGQLETAEGALPNYYGHFVKKFIDHFDQLSPVEAGDDDSGETSMRLTFEDDFSAVQQLAGPVDLQAIQREGQTLYGVDFMYANESKQLLRVIFWSTQGEETLDHVIQVGFSGINAISPNIIQSQISEELWQGVLAAVNQP